MEVLGLEKQHSSLKQRGTEGSSSLNWSPAEGLTVNPEVDRTSVLSSHEGVLASITPEGLRNGDAVDLPNDHIAKSLLQSELSSVLQPATLNIILIDFKFNGSSVFLQNLQQEDRGSPSRRHADGDRKASSREQANIPDRDFTLSRWSDPDVPTLHRQLGFGDAGPGNHRVFSSIRQPHCLDH